MPHHCSSALTSTSTCISESEFPLDHRRVQKARFWNEVVEAEAFGGTMINMDKTSMDKHPPVWSPITIIGVLPRS